MKSFPKPEKLQSGERNGLTEIITNLGTVFGTIIEYKEKLNKTKKNQKRTIYLASTHLKNGQPI